MYLFRCCLFHAYFGNRITCTHTHHLNELFESSPIMKIMYVNHRFINPKVRMYLLRHCGNHCFPLCLDVANKYSCLMQWQHVFCYACSATWIYQRKGIIKRIFTGLHLDHGIQMMLYNRLWRIKNLEKKVDEFWVVSANYHNWAKQSALPHKWGTPSPSRYYIPHQEI